MLLEVTNIGKIRKAAVEMRGITVIAGNNNTGKSTYGKILFCLFNAFCNAQDAIQKERWDNIEKSIELSYFPFDRLRLKTKIPINNIIEHQSSRDELHKLFKEVIGNQISIINNAEEAIDDTVGKIIRFGKITERQIQEVILSRFLRSEFGTRIVHVNHTDESGEISLTIKGRKLFASINNNEGIDYGDNVGIIYNALYIDTPFILDELSPFPVFQRNGHRAFLLESLSKSPGDVNALDEILTKQQFQRVLSNIRTVVDGEFTRDEGNLGFLEKGLNAPLEMVNISTGMKPFLIIKRLLEVGAIKARGVLVFDEPEIHLHPEWQIKYAELLVLLQKEFDLNILLTTHSPYFLNAIEVYSQKHDSSEHCNYYLSETQGDACTLEEVTGDLTSIYQKLAKPFQELENSRYEKD
jgi:predicted ATPase